MPPCELRIATDLQRAAVVTVHTPHSMLHASTTVSSAAPVGCVLRGALANPARAVAPDPANVQVVMGNLPSTMTPDEVRWLICRLCGVTAFRIRQHRGRAHNPTGLFFVTVRGVDEDAVLACSGRALCFGTFAWLVRSDQQVVAARVAAILKANAFVTWGLLNVMVPAAGG
jgi:hypothetical protein